MGINQKLPHVGDAGRGGYILDWFQTLAARLRDVRITCGDWARVCTPVVTHRHGITAVFLDPPYDADVTTGLYAAEGAVSTAVREWCLANGTDDRLRIALCGYAGEHELPGWTEAAGLATNGGYGNSAGNQNHKRETIWFSPHCVGAEVKQPELMV
jgi:16S rRNA G966 N2-methylase RsmD